MCCPHKLFCWDKLSRIWHKRLDPHAWLKDVLQRLPTHQASAIEELLPHRWQPLTD
jgi:hypothetical protein